jgi:hypothetical protein
MIIEEGTVLILGNGARYYLIHEIGELEGYEGEYYFAIGVTENEKVNVDDIVFLQIRQTENGPIAKRLAENTEIYSVLSCLEITKVLIDTIPGYKDKLITDLEKIERIEESSQ